MQTPAEQEAGRESHKTVVKEGRKERGTSVGCIPKEEGGIAKLKKQTTTKHRVMETDAISPLNHWKGSSDVQESAFRSNRSTKHFTYIQPARSAPVPRCVRCAPDLHSTPFLVGGSGYHLKAWKIPRLVAKSPLKGELLVCGGGVVPQLQQTARACVNKPNS